MWLKFAIFIGLFAIRLTLFATLLMLIPHTIVMLKLHLGND